MMDQKSVVPSSLQHMHILSATHTSDHGQCDCSDCADCACTALSLPDTFLAPPPDVALQIAASLLRGPAAPGYEWILPSEGPAGMLVLDAAAGAALDAFAIARPPAQLTSPPVDFESSVARLVAAGVLRPADAVVLPMQPVVPRPTARALSAWLQLSDDCPLRCVYCYVPKARARMSPAQACQSVEAIFRSALLNGFPAVRLKYAGGEPLLNLPALAAAHRLARRLSETLRIEYEAVVLTSGAALSQAALNELVAGAAAGDLRVAVSLDGLGAAHDHQRPLANGRGSFAIVRRNLERMLERNIPLSVTLTLTAQNLEALPETVSFLLDFGIAFNINFYRSSRASAADPLLPSPRPLIAAVRAAFDIIAARPPSFSLAGVLDRVRLDAPHLRPCGAGHTYLAIDTHGRTAACPMLLDHALSLTSQGDLLTALQAAPTNFEYPDVDQRPGCQPCRWRSWCAGGCPLISSERSPYCEVYQALLPALARLEANRLISRRA